MLNRTVAAAGSAAAVMGLAVAACGGNDSGGGEKPPAGGAAESVTVYSSYPLQGAGRGQSEAAVNGAKLAVEQVHGKVGNITVTYKPLDDSTAQAATWTPEATSANARKAAQDKSTAIYLGEFNSGATAVALPILNEAGIAQVSPANTAVGLTTDDPGATPGEPDKYYPTGKRTYLRIVPRDTIQAAAVLTAMKQAGCTKVGIANDKEVYGAGIANLMKIQAQKFGITITSNTAIDKTAPNYRSYASQLKSQGVDCFFFGGVTANGAIQLYKDVAAALPTAKLYGPDGVCESGFTNPSKKGIPATVGSRFQCTVATLDLNSYPGGKSFLAAYKQKYGDAHPDPYAIYG